MSEDQKTTDIILRAHARGRELITVETLGKSVEELTDAELAMLAFGFLAMRAVAASRWPPVSQTCGWCIQAQGDTQEAKDAAVLYSFDEIKEHTTTCPHNPLVAELDRLRAPLLAARKRDPSKWETSVDGTGDNFREMTDVEMIEAMIENEESREARERG